VTHLLHLDASARGDSFSRKLGEVFVGHWQTAHPDGTYTYRDLLTEPALPLDEARVRLSTQSSVNGVKDIAAMDEVARAPALAEAWAATRPLIVELLTADVLLIGTPMYNSPFPARSRPGLTR
jgi:FMN-dependent NADH-azoreductase